jgi:hypothetical protein
MTRSRGWSPRGFPMLGRAGIVDNRPGANGIVGTEIAVAAPDGYTLLVANQTHVILGDLYTRLSFDPVRDFAPVSLAAVSRWPSRCIPRSRYTTLAELVAWMRANPASSITASAWAVRSPRGRIAQAAKVQITPLCSRASGRAITAVLVRDPELMTHLLVSMPREGGASAGAGGDQREAHRGLARDPGGVGDLPGLRGGDLVRFLAPRATPAPWSTGSVARSSRCCACPKSASRWWASARDDRQHAGRVRGGHEDRRGSLGALVRSRGICAEGQ